MISLNIYSNHHPKQAFKLAGKVLLQVLPLMLVLFLLVPRIAPIWSLNLSDSRAKVGLSDEVNVGDIAQLSQSDGVAFRAVFQGEQPLKQQLYWRALVLDQYDGTTWSRGNFAMDESPMVSFHGPSRGWHQLVTPLSSSISYRIMMEPTDQPWLVSLAGVTHFNREYGYSLDHRLVHPSPVSQPMAYNVKSALAYQLDLTLSDWMIEKNLQMPTEGDAKTRQLAARLKASSPSPESYIRQVLNYFATQGYSYTLRPGKLTQSDKIDEFLFDRQRGFCSHYAGAFVYLMRAAGIPARMVAGYQGGEYSQLGNYWLIHQFDAHAWAEVWIENRGWVRFDPTSVVAPDRISRGIEDAVQRESFLADNLFSAARYRNYPWLNQIRHGLDYLNYAWYQTVLGYDSDTQSRLLSQLLGEMNIYKLAIWLISGIAGLLVLLSIWVLGRSIRLKKDPLLEEYQRFCQKMARQGYPRNPQETPEAYSSRLQTLIPEQQQVLQQISRIFQRHYYASHHSDTSYASQKPVTVIRRLIANL